MIINSDILLKYCDLNDTINFSPQFPEAVLKSLSIRHAKS